MATKKLYQLPVIENTKICCDVYLLTLKSKELSETLLPGQFLHVNCGSSDFKLLRRPISIFDCDVETETIKLLYKVIGKGTTSLTKFNKNNIIDVIAPLGNSFNLQSKQPLIVGGGIGVAPLRLLVRKFNESGITPALALGFANKDQAQMANLFEDANCEINICTDDGSYGYHGNSCALTMELIKSREFDAIYSCGPEIMLANLPTFDGLTYVSLEAYMACGVGACLGCAVEKTSGGYAHVCKDGPVFKREEVILHG